MKSRAEWVVRSLAVAVVGMAGWCGAADYPIVMPRMGSVRATGGFWAAREATNRLVTAKANLKQSLDTGRIGNFENAAKKIRGEAHGPFKGIFFNDSDVYKVMEGMAYELAMCPDAEAAQELESLIGKVGGAQEPDGYLYTARTLGDRHERVGDHRWYCDDAHELYCMGHMIEAAVAHYETTGRDTFLKIACKAADMMRRTFGPGEGQIWFMPGHEEVELALCKLYRATGKKAYLEMAMDFLSTRGMPRDKRVGEVKRGFPDNHAYYQDHLPVREQKEAVGHAVRAGYLYTGMCDVGILSGDRTLLDAVDTLWNDIVTRKLYLSGGVGARPEIEGYGPAYDLPNDRVCLETCAAIANALFNERMFLRTGDSKYLDIVERIAYNGALCSISISGDEFFYPNPMASRGGYKRSKWFGCACCPPNVVRFIPQFIDWTYASDAKSETFYWNFFAETDADLGRVRFSQKTGYPWSGDAVLTVNPAKEDDAFALKVRIPGWARGIPAPGGLYAQTRPARVEDVRCQVNGTAVDVRPGRDGYVTIARTWRRGDTVSLRLPMVVKRIKTDDRVEQDRGRLAVERGPLVYCAEGVDNDGKAFNAVLPADTAFTESPIVIADTPMTALKGAGITLVPFFAWCHRGAGEMQTWFAANREIACGNSQGVFVSASHCWHLDSVAALFDGKLPRSSADESIPRFTFWNHTGTEEWVELELPMRKPVKSIEVYWFDDRHVNRGACALPERWSVQSRLFPGLPWTDIEGAAYTTVMDGFSAATFPKPVESEVFRIVVKSHPKLSVGMLEVRVKDK
ncbi:MAG: glycoside hydrolase family 127 protein [Kiritimatiellae bacterium]|nr:glycoside hydrolase family 127 protein [Kiritimatiellia bacterium]